MGRWPERGFHGWGGEGGASSSQTVHGWMDSDMMRVSRGCGRSGSRTIWWGGGEFRRLP